jgi:transposase
LIAPQYAKPFVKRNKNDAADAEAICEAVTQANQIRGLLAEFGIIIPQGISHIAKRVPS